MKSWKKKKKKFLVAIKFEFEYKFVNCKSSTLIEFEIYNNLKNYLAYYNFSINLFKGNLGNF